jgi:hypothetical protein
LIQVHFQSAQFIFHDPSSIDAGAAALPDSGLNLCRLQGLSTVCIEALSAALHHQSCF